MKKGVDKRERLMYNITRTIEARVRKTPVIFSPKSARNLENWTIRKQETRNDFE